MLINLKSFARRGEIHLQNPTTQQSFCEGNSDPNLLVHISRHAVVDAKGVANGR
jgi:hypothetical protein